MPDTVHYPGGVLSVEADDEGHARCIGCGCSMFSAQMYMLVRHPKEPVWFALCWECSKLCTQAINTVFTAVGEQYRLPVL